MGVLNCLTSDNGPQFKSKEFKTYCKKWGIQHDPPSPYHHITNGHVEAAVKSIKGLVKKISPGRMCHTPEFINALMEYRNTERKDGLSLAQRLFGRPTHTRLPTHPLVFNRPIQDEIWKADKKARRLLELAKARYDQGTRELGVLEVRDVVRVQHHMTKRWDLIGKIEEVNQRDCGYLVHSKTGRLYWHNRRFIKPLYKGPEGGVSSRTKSSAIAPVKRSDRKKRAPVRSGLT